MVLTQQCLVMTTHSWLSRACRIRFTSLPEEGVNLKEYLSELEVNLIRQALDNQEWVVARAADKLGMRRTTLVEKMRKYDIQRTEEA